MNKVRSLSTGLTFLIGALLSSNSYAVLGMPDNTARIGFSLGAARLHVADPAGDTRSVYALQPVKLMYSDWLQAGYRFWIEGYYQEASLDAGENMVGQYFQEGGSRVAIQKNFTIADFLKPWIGVGMDLSLGRYTLRHTIDDEGYLVDQYADRTHAAVGGLLYLVNEWQITRDWSAGATFLQRFSINKAVNESSLSMFFLMRY